MGKLHRSRRVAPRVSDLFAPFVLVQAIPVFGSVPCAVAVLLAAPICYLSLASPARPGDVLAWLRRIGFTALGCFIVFQLSARWAPEPEPPAGPVNDVSRGFRSFASGVFSYRMGLSPLAEIAPTEGKPMVERGLDSLREAARAIPSSVYLQRYFGIALAERGKIGEASAVLDRACDLLAERAPERARVERDLWRLLLSDDAPTSDQIAGARGTIAGLGLGWIGDVGLLAAEQRPGGVGVEPATRARVRDGAASYVRRLTIAAIGLLFLVPQLALIAILVGRVLYRDGLLRFPAHDVGPGKDAAVRRILVESFLLLLFFAIAPQWLPWINGRPAPEVRPAAAAWRLVTADLLQLGAVVYLVVGLRRAGSRPAVVGLTRDRLGLNAAIGVGAACILIPVGYILALMTDAVSQRLFPNLAPANHPLGIMTATSTSPEIRWALTLTAVVGAPLLEEIFFRGALHGALRRRWGIWPGILLSATVFSLLHPQLPLGFLPIALLGAAFAVLYEWRQSLIPGIVAHAVNNSLPLLLLNLAFPAQG